METAPIGSHPTPPTLEVREPLDKEYICLWMPSSLNVARATTSTTSGPRLPPGQLEFQSRAGKNLSGMRGKPKKPPNATKPRTKSSEECPKDNAECILIYNSIILSHDADQRKAKDYFFLPFSWVYLKAYHYKQLLPLAMAVPNSGEHKNVPAFKVLFCPGGVGTNFKDRMKILPAFNVYKGFVSNARKFVANRFPEDKDLIKLVIENCCSIWVLGITLEKTKWCTQIVGTVIYTSLLGSQETGGTNNIEASVYINYIVAQGSDSYSGEIRPSITPDDYSFKANSRSDIQIENSHQRVQDALGDRVDDAFVGSRRLGVMLLSLVQIMHLQNLDGTREEDLDPPKLFLQSNVRSFAFTRYGVLGFQYVTTHMKTESGGNNQLANMH